MSKEEDQDIDKSPLYTYLYTFANKIKSLLSDKTPVEDLILETRALAKDLEFIMDEKHNGYTNKATWNTNLWFTNEEDIYNTIKDIVSIIKSYSTDLSKLDSIVMLEYALVETFIGLWGYVNPDGHELGKVNFFELARMYYEGEF